MKGYFFREDAEKGCKELEKQTGKECWIYYDKTRQIRCWIVIVTERELEVKL